MATLCSNCGYPLVYDPITRRVVCDACGSAFFPEQIESYDKEFALNENEAVKEFMNCNVYTCSSCGGEIVISGQEVSTTCIYCGSPSVIFSRISQTMRPDFILPFQFGREQATEIIRQRFKRGTFIPQAFRNLQPESVHGIYIPYWLVNVYHAESDIYRGEDGSGENSSTYYYARAGRIKLNNLLVESSMELNDESSARLAPYDLRKLKHFDEEYLLGFYSDMSDMTYGELRKTADARASAVLRATMSKDIRAHGCRVLDGRSATLIDKNMTSALLPAWFVTVQFEGKPHTILVNGDTGKIVCGLPWSKIKFWSLVGLVGGGITFFASIIYFIIGFFFSAGFGGMGGMGIAAALSSLIPTIMPAIFINLVFFLIGLFFYKKVDKQIKLTQSTDTFRFTKKRQG